MPNEPLRLLLIEDNPGDAIIFREKVAASGLDASVKHVLRLQDALDCVACDPYDLLLVDLSLPDAEGLESVERMRRAVPHLPLIVLTGLDDAAMASEAKKRGAVDYLVKWYMDDDALARYIRYAVAQYHPYSDGGVRAASSVHAPQDHDTASENPPPAAPSSKTLDVRPDAPPAQAPAGEDLPAAVEGDVLVPALQAALAVAREQSARADHLVGSLTAALALGDSAAPQPALLDVHALVRSVCDDARDRALASGVPLRVPANALKATARVDEGSLRHALGRLVALALATADDDGIGLAVAREGDDATIRAAWTVREGAHFDAPHAALDQALCARYAARAGGRFSLSTDAARAEALFAIPSP